MAKRQPTDLSLVHTNLLLKELLSRFDLGIFVGCRQTAANLTEYTHEATGTDSPLFEIMGDWVRAMYFEGLTDDEIDPPSPETPPDEGDETEA